MNTLQQHLAEPPTSRRGALLAAIMLTAITVVHLIDGPGSLEDQFYVGALELALAIACIPLAILLIINPIRDLWIEGNRAPASRRMRERADERERLSSIVPSDRLKVE